MKEYQKIQSLFKRDKTKKLLIGEYTNDEFKYLENNIWFFTEKINGTNICVKWDGSKIRFGNLDQQIPTKLVNLCMNIFKPEKFKEVFKQPEVMVELYFEGYGKGIQEPDGSKYNPNENSLILFDINIDGWWLDYNSCVDICEKLNLNIVPKIADGTLIDLVTLVKQGFKSCVSKENMIAEGIVAKPWVPLYNKKGERIITKLKYLDFPLTERGKVNLDI